MTQTKEDQRSEIRFCVCLGMNRGNIQRHLRRAHGAQTLSKSQINRWIARIEADPNVSMKDRPRNLTPRKLTPAKLAQIQGVVQQDKRVTTRRVSAATGVSNGTAHKALRKHLNMKKKSAKWIPHLLTNAQRIWRVTSAQQCLQRI